MILVKTRPTLPRILFAFCFALWLAPRVPAQSQALLAADDSLPGIRRVYVPADRPDLWPKGDWQPIPLTELERQLEWAGARLSRPGPCIQRADYSATLVDGELRDGGVEWQIHRPDPFGRMLSVGRMNLNVSKLAWSEPASTPADSKSTKQSALTREVPVPALWGTTPGGTTAIVVDRRQGRLVGDWSLSGRKLAASVEFDLELPPATMSRITLKIPAGLVLSSTAGEVTSTAETAEPGWKEWRVNLGSRTTARLRVCTGADPATARPLIIVRSNLNYVVRSEAVRVLAEFAVEPLETLLREVHLDVDPDIQITSVEYGDGGAAAWKSPGNQNGSPNGVTNSALNPARDGGHIVVQLPDSPAGDVPTLRILGIAQIKSFAAWTLPRIRVQNSVEEAGKLTLRIQPPLVAADVRTDGYLQTELTTSAADGETLVFKQLRSDGTITLVPSDGKPDLACRVVTLLISESNQWTLISQMEWTAASGSAFAAKCLIPDQWEIVDVRPAQGDNPATLSGWDVEELGPERRILHVYFSNALEADRPQRIRIAARRLPPGLGEKTPLPPLIPSDAAELEQYIVVTTGPEWRPVVESATEIERLTIRDLPEEARRIDFLSARLSDRHSRFLVFRTVSPSVAAGLSIEPFERPAVLRTNSQRLGAPADFRPDPPSEPETPATGPMATGPLAPATRELPVSLSVSLQVSDLSTGFDHYRARVRLPVVDDRLTFRWVLAQPAELTGVTVDGRQVAPLNRNGSYSIEDLPVVAGNREPVEIPEKSLEKISVVELEYRVPAMLHAGRNSRKLLLPVPAGPVLQFELDLAVSDRIRLAAQPTGIRLAGFDEQFWWQKRLLGPFARPAGTAIFNPFSLASWSSLPFFTPSGLGGQVAGNPEREHVWKGASASLPDGAEFAIWKSDEASWLSIGALAFCALIVIWMRLAQAAIRRTAVCFAILCLCLGALMLPAVEAEIAGAALTGLVLAVLLPKRALEFVRGPAPRQADEIPVGSTQSFVPLAGLLLFGMLLGGGILGLDICGLSPVVLAQEDRRPVANAEALAGPGVRPTLDILIPVDSAGYPAGEIPLAYLSSDLSARLSLAAQAARLPPCLIGSVVFAGHVDETNQLLVLASFDVQVLATDPVVRVHLPVGKVNLGGVDACLVDGRPHPVIAPPQRNGLWLDLSGCEPRGDPPEVPFPQIDAMTGPVEHELPDEPTPVRACRVELRLHPPIDAGRADTSSALVTIPPGCRTQASLTAVGDLSVLGIIPLDAAKFVSSQRQPADGPSRIDASPGRSVREHTDRTHTVRIRPFWNQPASSPAGPAGQLMFFWSDIPGAGSLPAAEMQVGISCLADVTPALIQLRYHIAYHLQSGHVDSLVWHVPAGYVLQSVQAPQLAGFRFRPGEAGGREMLVEFSRPQEEDFSLTATFALPIDRQVKPLPLPLLDPLRSENGNEKHISLRFHQFALRQPSDMSVNISPPGTAERDQVLKPRAVKEFLKEWNAGGARPPQAFDLARLFALQLDIENLPAQPGVRGSAVGHFRPGRLDWTYTAEIDRSPVGQFVYRLHVDPRLKIRAVSVQEDGAERLLRPSLLRETLVLLLNDQATRMQTLRIDASLPIAATQEIELPRIRLVGATPGPEHITLFRDADLSVRVANPEDFPLPPAASPAAPPSAGNEQGALVGRERLVARLDCLPDQANPRVEVEPVSPQIAAESAIVMENNAGSWQVTTCVRFQVLSGRAETFKIEVPESLASRFDVRSTPTSRTTSERPVNGRITLVLHPDEPLDDDPFVVVLTGTADLAQGVWQLPVIEFPGAEQTATILIVPHFMTTSSPVPGTSSDVTSAQVPADAFDVPEWLKTAVPATAPDSKSGPGWKAYRWPGAAPEAEVRAAHEASSEAGIDSARLDIWVEPDGSIEGWLGLNLSQTFPSTIEFDWPAGCDPTALYVAGEFVALPAVEPQPTGNGVWTVSCPPTAKRDLVWLSWRDHRNSLPPLSGPELAARVPWPRSVPVARCTMHLHAPVHYRIDAGAPAVATAGRSPNALPPLVAHAEERDLSPGADISVAITSASRPRDEAGAGAGTPLQLASALRIVNEGPRHLALSIAVALLISALCWKTARFWSWLTQHETLAWVALSVIWCLWLDPSWVGPLVAFCACLRALWRRDRAIADRERLPTQS